VNDRVNILLVDDQPAKLLSYEVILGELGENLIMAASAREALEHLLKTEVAVVLIDVCMPELDGFELAAMIRDHPRFQRTALIFVSAIHLTDIDRLRGYEAGAVDYVPVPVVPEVLRAKVRVFAELYRKTRDLERLNEELERRVAERTAALEASTAQLRESEQRRSMALAAGQMGSWEWSPGTGSVIWDAGQFRLFGVEPDRFEPNLQNIRAMIHPEDLQQIEELIATRSGDTHAFQAELRVLRPDGRTRWCICAAATSRDPQSGGLRVNGVTIDITERKQVEQGLHRLNEELEHRIEERTREREHALAQLFEAQKLDTIGQLTGGVAHDFNNLLMAVLGSLGLLKKRLPDDERARRLLENAIQGAERGAALTQRLLAFARRQELKPEAVHVASLVSGMEDLLKRALGPGIRIAKCVPETLSPVRADANQLELALLNLAVNARDAMPLGGSLNIVAVDETVPGRSVAPRGLARGAYVRLSVSDNGIGMDEATLAKATEPFFTTKGPGKGTGLGLSMVHGLAAQSGGALAISSAPEKGTTVDLWLPKADMEVVARLAPEDRRVEEVRISPRTVLVVDDDPLVSTGTAAMLEDLGHVVIEANSGAQALEILGSDRRIDIVVTDYAMPGMTGMELARHIQSAHPGLPVILASGYAELAFSDGCDLDLSRLSKPYRQQDLAVIMADIPNPRASLAKAIIPLRVG
jgi:PAS domain S-box-containing protein